MHLLWIIGAAPRMHLPKLDPQSIPTLFNVAFNACFTVLHLPESSLAPINKTIPDICWLLHLLMMCGFRLKTISMSAGYEVHERWVGTCMWSIYPLSLMLILRGLHGGLEPLPADIGLRGAQPWTYNQSVTGLTCRYKLSSSHSHLQAIYSPELT